MKKIKISVVLLLTTAFCMILTACGNNRKADTKKPEKLPTYNQISKKAAKYKKYQDFYLVSKNGDQKGSETLSMRFTFHPYSYYVYSRDEKDSVLEVWNINNSESYMKQGNQIVKSASQTSNPNHALSKNKFGKLLRQMGTSFQDKDTKSLNWKVSQNKKQYVLTYKEKKPSQKKIKDYIGNDHRISISMKHIYGTVQNVTIQYFINKKNYAIEKNISKYEIMNGNNISKVCSSIVLNSGIKVTVPKKVKENAVVMPGTN